MEESIELVGRFMCEECDAFLGKPHAESCSKHGGLVEQGDATEKFTTTERVAQEEPLLAMDPEMVELILRSLIPSETAGDDAETLTKLREGLQAFLDATNELQRQEDEG